MDEKALRKDLTELLTGGHAYAKAETVLDGIIPANRSAHPSPSLHSVWEELEHLRLAQEDILQYALDAFWKSPPWPAGYWPEPVESVSDESWQSSVSAFLAGRDRLLAMVNDGKTDLTAAFAHGEGRTYLRQILLAADHNAYHLGQIVSLRKLQGNWTG